MLVVRNRIQLELTVAPPSLSRTNNNLSKDLAWWECERKIWWNYKKERPE